MTTEISPAELYEEDFYAWTRAQARELRQLREARSNLPLDIAHLAEEIESLGREQRNAIRSWIRQIIAHLLLLENEPRSAPRAGWRSEVLAARQEIEDRITATLRRSVRATLGRSYQRARRLAEYKLREHGRDEAAHALPETCPYTLDQILGDWWPDEEGR